MPFRLDQALEVLESTPRTLETWLSGLSEHWLASNEGAETFSPLDVLGHLIHGEETDWIPRLRTILEHGESKPFEPFDRFAFRRTLAGVGACERLALFARLRRENLAVVRSLDLQPSELAKRGTHPALGAVTLEQLLSTWVVHDLGHLAQIARVMSRQYREDVGPWREYLPVLDQR
jgi:DinB superfamily